MAIFNPQVQQGRDEMPDWTKVTKPISELQVDKSKGLALATVGQGIESGAELAEQTAKDVINKDVRNTVEPIREDYTNQLLATKAIVQGVGAQVPPSGQKMDLTQGADAGTSVPEGINAGINKVDRLQNMIKYGSGKLGVDETYYDMQLKNAVTSLRSRYPGFVDYIDSKVSAITGMNPANETIRDLTSQIAQLQSSKKSEYDKVVDMARSAVKDGMRGAREQYETLIQRGPEYVPTFLKQYESESRKWQEIKEADQLRQSRKAGEADDRETRTKDWTNYVSAEVSTAMGTTLSISGLSDKKTLQEFIEDFQSNPDKYNSDMMRQLAVMVKAQGAQVGARIDTKATETKKDAAGKYYSFNSDIGAEEVTKTKTAIMKYFDNMHDALMRQDGGLAFLWAQRAAGMMDNTKYKVYAAPEGEILRRLEVLKNSAGETAVPTLLTAAVKEGIDKSVNDLFTNNLAKAKIQEDPAKPYTFKGMNDEALNLEQQGQIAKGIRSRYINGGMNTMLKDITDTDTPDPAKLNALKFFFSPEGQGVLNHFNNDRVNPLTGKQEPGKQTIWNRLTSPEVAKEIHKLSQRYPEAGVAYTNWLTKEAGAGLFYKDLLNLNTITGRDDLYIKFNDGKNGGVPQIELLSDKGALESPVGQQGKIPQYGIPDYTQGGVDVGRRTPYEGQVKMAQQSINRVNEALRGIDRVYKVFGGDSSAMLLNFMNSAQVEMGSRWEGLPAKIMDAIAAAQGKGKLKDLFEEKQKQKEKK